MKLEINDPEKLLDKAFMKWLATELKDYIIYNLNTQKADNWSKYLTDSKLYNNIYNNKINARSIIISGASNLDIVSSEDAYIIKINPNIYTSGLDRVKLDTICRLINFGNTELVGYPIFTKSFQYFADNIHEYVEKYLLISGG